MSKTGRLAHLFKGGNPARASETAAEGEDEEEEDQPVAEGEDEEEQDDEANTDEGDDEEENTSARAGNSTIDAAFGLLRSPEAKGRDKLAAELAEDVAKGRMSAERAKRLLAAAPKKGTLADAMEGRDRNPGRDTVSASSELTKSEQSLLATSKRMQEQRAARRAR
ncbi:hypothetical protein H2509_20515 [Stappia sp. F7233]|uniref:Uncharacterized protein n=1 Tax=Stappia albiluteola TaxID=2758565 RepID=A0A839AIF6_9HYPH|nr:hypothetical protein [Stappia albiluteola]MBA5779521.1 hypothetical protein [Stappia albiluteola]